MLFLAKDQISDMGIKIFPSISTDAKNDYGNKTMYFSNTSYRIVSSLSEYTNGISWWDDIVTNPQKKSLGAWLRAQLNTKSAHDDGYKAFCTGCTQYPIYASSVENTGLSQQNIAFGGTQISMDASYCPAYSRGRLNTEYIYVYWPDALAYPASAIEHRDWGPDVYEPF
jgi:hypothetical protein